MPQRSLLVRHRRGFEPQSLSHCRTAGGRAGGRLAEPRNVRLDVSASATEFGGGRAAVSARTGGRPPATASYPNPLSRCNCSSIPVERARLGHTVWLQGATQKWPAALHVLLRQLTAKMTPADGPPNGKDGEEVVESDSDRQEPVEKKRRGPNVQRDWRLNGEK